MPLPEVNEARIAFSTFGSILGLPIAFPLRVPHFRALAMPAMVRSVMIERSNSAKTPSI
jgi:hypothetical protein